MTLLIFTFSTLLDHLSGMEVNEMGKSAVDVLDARQWTPLHVAVKCSEETNALLLLENGADPNAKAKKEDTPLHKAELFIRFGLKKILYFKMRM